MGSRKVNTEDIDEELLIASIGRRTQDGNTRPAQEPPAVPAEESTGGTEPPAAKEKTSRESSRRKRQEEDRRDTDERGNRVVLTGKGQIQRKGV